MLTTNLLLFRSNPTSASAPLRECCPLVTTRVFTGACRPIRPSSTLAATSLSTFTSSPSLSPASSGTMSRLTGKSVRGAFVVLRMKQPGKKLRPFRPDVGFAFALRLAKMFDRQMDQVFDLLRREAHRRVGPLVFLHGSHGRADRIEQRTSAQPRTFAQSLSPSSLSLRGAHRFVEDRIPTHVIRPFIQDSSGISPITVDHIVTVTKLPKTLPERCGIGISTELSQLVLTGYTR